MYLLRVSDPADLARVRDFLRNVHVVAQPRDDDTVIVSLPQALSELHERREIAGYVTTWNALNPGRPIELIHRPQPGA
ncbi:MAG: hypothetical protein QOH95_701 [Gaiellaceae bacterium]|nr:hypothetical protein [Gaiellaceae bacterium]